MSQVNEYTIETLNLADDNVATLISLPARPNVPVRGAILYVHGFIDYFFHDHVASYFTGRGWHWFALDLRRNGRSIRSDDECWYTANLLEYYEEIDLAMERIRAINPGKIVLMGHSTGGLTTSLWAHDRRAQHPIDALVLNSPWLDLQDNWFAREILTWAIRGIGAVQPLSNVPGGLSSVYPRSLHRDAEGEWDFNTDWKPLTAQPVKMGFLATVRRQQARLHRGLDVGMPVLQLRSNKSALKLPEWTEEAMHADTVLNVDQMARWLPKIGRDITDISLVGALHDVTLSAAPVRERALAEMNAWLDQRLGG